MTITPSSLLSLPIVTTGTESGVWGDVVNNGLTAYLDIAVAGGLPLTITTTDVTLVKTAGTSSATAIDSTTAQYAILNISGAKTAARNLNLPGTSKWYIINNAGTGGFLLTVRGVAPTTGVTLVDGEECIVAWNGTDFVKVASSVVTALTGTLSAANGGTGMSNLATNNVLLGNGTSAVQVIAPSTSGNVLTSNGTTWTSAAAGVAATVFTATGDFTIPAGITRIKMTIVGGGGGGGVGTGGCSPVPGSGGGGGGAAIKWLTGLTSGNTLRVTVGAAGAINGGTGGTSSVATGTSGTPQSITTVSATGGSGGANASAGGAGGLGSSGDLNIGGNAGNGSNSSTGGGSIFGGGGAGNAVGRAYGGGGGGGNSASGALGATGVVFIEY
jgi:hypothetical protein